MLSNYACIDIVSKIAFFVHPSSLFIPVRLQQFINEINSKMLFISIFYIAR